MERRPDPVLPSVCSHAGRGYSASSEQAGMPPIARVLDLGVSTVSECAPRLRHRMEPHRPGHRSLVMRAGISHQPPRGHARVPWWQRGVFQDHKVVTLPSSTMTGARLQALSSTTRRP